MGLDPDTARDRRPHEFSGGQCQRISIARAVITDPKLIICDEPVSALDVSVQAQILNLLEDMKRRYDLTMVFIAHDLAVVKNVSDRVAVMYLGKLCEVGPPDQLYASPAHPYTAALLAAIPVPDPEALPDHSRVLGGEIPSNIDPPSGCRFRTRCPKAQAECADGEPLLPRNRPRAVRGVQVPARTGRAPRLPRGSVVDVHGSRRRTLRGPHRGRAHGGACCARGGERSRARRRPVRRGVRGSTRAPTAVRET